MKFLRTTAVAAASALLLAVSTPVNATAIEAPKGTYELDLSHASIIWKVNHLGLSNYAGRFTKFSSTLDFDPETPEKSKLSVEIDPLSVETDFPNPEKKDFNNVLATGKEWFNAEKFPKITFVSKKIEKLTDTTGKVHGDLTLLGKTKPVTLDVTLNGSLAKHPYADGVGALGFSATTVFRRSDFGMDYLVPDVGEVITVQIEAEYIEKKPAEAKKEDAAKPSEEKAKDEVKSEKKAKTESKAPKKN